MTSIAFQNLIRMSATAACIVALASPALAEDDAAKILKAMTDYTASQKSISATFDSDIEVVTPDLQKLQFTSSGEIRLDRPDKLRIKRTGGYTDVDMVFDGKTFTLYGNNAKGYIQANMSGSVDQLIDRLQSTSGGEIPGADLLLTHSFDELTTDVVDATHVGEGVVDGVLCEHLAFRGVDTDWQIWIESGANPIPRKYVITSKTLAGAPQYSLTIKDWKTDVPVDANTYVFKPPEGAIKADLSSLAAMDFDEVPLGITEGAKK